MKKGTVEAVYEHGGFRLVAPADLRLAEGQKVRLVVERIPQGEDVIALAGQVYEGLTDEQISSIEQHVRRREGFFAQKAPE